MTYAIGHISDRHLNLTVSIGLWMGGRFEGKNVVLYIIAQVIVGMAGGLILYLIASGKYGFEVGGFAASRFGENSPSDYSMISELVMEVVIIFIFLFAILGVTH